MLFISELSSQVIPLATIKIGLAPYMALSWNEIKTRANAFSKEWHDAANEYSQAKPFLIGFFEVFGITNKRVATFEHAVKKYCGKDGYVDLFWPGILLVEMKSRGKDAQACL